MHSDRDELSRAAVDVEIRVNLGKLNDLGVCKRCGVFDELDEFARTQAKRQVCGALRV